MRKLENSKTIGDESALPEDWNTFTEYDFMTMIRNLDKYQTGSVNWKTLATLIILLKCPIPNDKDADAYLNELNSNGGE